MRKPVINPILKSLIIIVLLTSIGSVIWTQHVKKRMEQQKSRTKALVEAVKKRTLEPPIVNTPSEDAVGSIEMTEELESKSDAVPYVMPYAEFTEKTTETESTNKGGLPDQQNAIIDSTNKQLRPSTPTHLLPRKIFPTPKEEAELLRLYRESIIKKHGDTQMVRRFFELEDKLRNLSEQVEYAEINYILDPTPDNKAYLQEAIELREKYPEYD